MNTNTILKVNIHIHEGNYSIHVVTENNVEDFKYIGCIYKNSYKRQKIFEWETQDLRFLIFKIIKNINDDVSKDQDEINKSIKGLVKFIEQINVKEEF